MPLINLVDLLTCVLVKLTHSKSKLYSPCWTTPPVSLFAPEPLRLREAVAIKCCASTALVPAHHHLCQQQRYRLLLWERKVCCGVSPLSLQLKSRVGRCGLGKDLEGGSLHDR